MCQVTLRFHLPITTGVQIFLRVFTDYGWRALAACLLREKNVQQADGGVRTIAHEKKDCMQLFNPDTVLALDLTNFKAMSFVDALSARLRTGREG